MYQMSAIKMAAFKVTYVRWTLREDVSPPPLWNGILCHRVSDLGLSHSS